MDVDFTESPTVHTNDKSQHGTDLINKYFLFAFNPFLTTYMENNIIFQLLKSQPQDHRWAMKGCQCPLLENITVTLMGHYCDTLVTLTFDLLTRKWRD